MVFLTLRWQFIYQSRWFNLRYSTNYILDFLTQELKIRLMVHIKTAQKTAAKELDLEIASATERVRWAHETYGD